MKFAASVAALAGLSAASNVRRGVNGEICPNCAAGETVYLEGCPTCCAHTTQVTVPVQYPCPTTETIVLPGTTYCSTYTQTCQTYEAVPTTVYDTVSCPDVTYTQAELAYQTLTQYCPYTETLVEDGKTSYLTETSTLVETTQVPSGVTVTATCPDATYTQAELAYQTLTQYCPYTETKVENGETIYLTEISTQVQTTQVPIGVTVTATCPGVTLTQGELVLSTITAELPYTETQVVNGETKYVTQTSTCVQTVQVPSGVTVTAQCPDVTQTRDELVQTTVTAVIPYTETQVIDGETKYITKTSTQVQTTQVPSGVTVTAQRPDVTQTQDELVESTFTAVCPYTETQVIEGQTIQETLTSTRIQTTQVPSGVTVTAQCPDVTQTSEALVDSTVTAVCPYTETQVVEGQTLQETITATRIQTTQVPSGVTVTATCPDVIQTSEALVESTVTAVCPYTTTAVQQGSTAVITTSSTCVVSTQVPQTAVVTQCPPAPPVCPPPPAPPVYATGAPVPPAPPAPGAPAPPAPPAPVYPTLPAPCPPGCPGCPCPLAPGVAPPAPSQPPAQAPQPPAQVPQPPAQVPKPPAQVPSYPAPAPPQEQPPSPAAPPKGSTPPTAPKGYPPTITGAANAKQAPAAALVAGMLGALALI